MSARTPNAIRRGQRSALAGCWWCCILWITRVHGITVEPPAVAAQPQYTYSSVAQHNQFRSAFDLPAGAGSPGSAYRPRTPPPPPTQLPPQLAYYAKTAADSNAAPATVAASDYYAGTQSVVRNVQQNTAHPHTTHSHTTHSHTANPHTAQPQAHAKPQPVYESEIATVIEAPSTRIIVRDFTPMRQTGAYTRSQRYRPAEHVIIHTYELPAGVRPHRYGFRPNAAYNRPAVNKPGFLRSQGVVRATNPPPGPNDPPLPTTKYPYTPTYQIDQLLRKYRGQQLVDARSPKQTPHYRNSAMHEVQAPNLKYRERPLRTQINQLKEQQRMHFGVAADEHPAQSDSNEIRPSDAQHGVYSKGRDVYRQQEQEFEDVRPKPGAFKPSQHLSSGKLFRPSQPAVVAPTRTTEGFSRHKFAEKIVPTTASYDHSSIRPKFASNNRAVYNNYETTTSGYDALRNSLSADIDAGLSSYRSSIDGADAAEKFRTEYDPLKFHSDPFDSPYKNFISSEDEDESGSDETDATTSHYDFKRYQQQAPKFIKPVQYSTYIDRSFTKPTTDASSEAITDEFVPYRMLASVRHTERVQHRPRPEAGEPTVREKIHEEGGHIVYSEQGYEDEQYDHGEEERAAVYKNTQHSSRRRRRSTGIAEREYPFYLAPTRFVPEISALRYSSAEGRRARQAQRFYDTKRGTNCDEIDFDESQVNDKPTDAKQKKRLRGLGDKLDCLRRKFFGVDPLSNPIFKEQLVSDQTLFAARPKRESDAINATHNEATTKVQIPGVVANSSLVHPSLSRSSQAALVHTLPNVHETPTIILLNERALAKVRANPSMPLADILRFPEVEQSEVFIFDVAKFVPRLFMNPDDKSRNSALPSTRGTVEPKVIAVAATTTKLKTSDAIGGRKRKYVRTAFKNRRPNHNYSKVQK